MFTSTFIFQFSFSEVTLLIPSSFLVWSLATACVHHGLQRFNMLLPSDIIYSQLIRSHFAFNINKQNDNKLSKRSKIPAFCSEFFIFSFLFHLKFVQSYFHINLWFLKKLCMINIMLVYTHTHACTFVHYTQFCSILSDSAALCMLFITTYVFCTGFL